MACIPLNPRRTDQVPAQSRFTDARITTPEGFNGVNGLLDTLGGMGVIPADQVTGVRMMLGLFTKPGAEGEDKLTTDLEFKEGGTVFANGQQVR